MFNPFGPCSTVDENTFGPAVSSSCLGGFDFTLLFEESILTVLPLGLACLWACLRAWILRHQTTKVRASWLLPAKLVTYSLGFVLQSTLAALWTDSDVPRTKATIATTALSMGTAIVLAYISFVEHMRSVRPSTFLVLYTGFSLLLDLARVRTLFFVPASRTVAGIFLAHFLVKLVTFLLENTEKRRLLVGIWRDSSPEETCGIAPRVLFTWLGGLFLRGLRTILNVNTLTPLDDEILTASQPRTLYEKWQKASKKSEHALLWTFIKHYKWALLSGVLPRLAYTGFTFAQPFLVQRVLDFVVEPRTANTDNIAYGLIGAYAIVYIGIALSNAVYQHKTYRVLTMFRGSLITLIFDKTLRLGAFVTSNAEAITLMSADIDRIGVSMNTIQEVYASVLELGLSLWLLYRLLGVAMAASTGHIVVCLAIGIPLAIVTGNAQRPWLEAIERRLAVTTRFLGAMKAVRMAGLTDAVSSKTSVLRLAEIRASRRFRILNALVVLTFWAAYNLAPLWGFGVYIFLAKADGSRTLTEGIAFAALSLFQLQENPLIHLIDGLEQIQVVANSFRRIQVYLLSEERCEYRITPSSANSSGEKLPIALDEKSETMPLDRMSKPAPVLDDEESESAVSFKHVSAGYSNDALPVLNDLDLNIPHGKITMILGPVASGKSTFLRALLGELPSVCGSIITSFSRAAVCTQSPWIMLGTLQQNILGMSLWDKSWYDKVIEACALNQDFQTLPRGDQTEMGTRGARLSGGQQTRVSLARAIYSRNSVLVLDDVLTGLDLATERHILEALFGAGGMLASKKFTVILATNSVNPLRYADHIIVLNSDGRVAQEGTLAAVSSNSEQLQQLLAQSGTQAARTEAKPIDATLQEADLPQELVEPRARTQAAGDMTIYAYYARHAGWFNVVLYLFACSTFVFGVTFPSVWLQWWSRANEEAPNQRIGYWLGVYAALAATAMLGCFGMDLLYNLVVIPRTSKAFHSILLKTTMSATTSFLTTTDAGTTTNRFSQDLSLIDNDLPRAIDFTVFYALSAIVGAVLVFIGSGYVAATIPVSIVTLYAIQLFYLRTSRQIRILDIEAKAPLFSQFLEVIGGISSVRAYGWVGDYMERHYGILNTSQKPYYLLWCVQRWLTVVLDLFVAGVAIVLVTVTTLARGGTTGFLGVALFQVVNFSTTLRTLVTEWTQVETAIGAISRIRAYVAETSQEHTSGETGELPAQWPSEGAVSFNDVSASYQSSLEPVIQGVSLSIEAGEKVAVCGRTGRTDADSGKSSLISTLLCMLDLDSGRITVDGMDIGKMPRKEVRKRLNTLPQEPFFLSGSARDNVDPAGTTSNEQVAAALRAVQMWDFVEAGGGLDARLSEEQLSHGQRQLLCLARAIIKPCRIVIMDEATSSIDAETEELMQRVIRSEFEDRTIVAVVHKLHTVLDFDKVAVLERGRVIEIGNPRELLEVETSAFATLFRSMV